MFYIIYLFLIIGDKNCRIVFSYEVFSSEVANVKLVFSKPYSHVVSANFPAAYPKARRFSWELVAPLGRKITLRKLFFQLRATDRLKIFHVRSSSSFLIAEYNGSAPAFRKLISPSNSMRIELISNNFVDSASTFPTGFNISFEITGYCSKLSSRRSCGPHDPGVCYSVADYPSSPPSQYTLTISASPQNNNDRSYTDDSILQDDLCDGIWDCPNSGRDESNCEYCPPDLYPCALTNSLSLFNSTSTPSPACYSFHSRCDGIFDCPDMSDELMCTALRCTLENSRFICDQNGLFGQCIPLKLVCNGVVDCISGADESTDLCLRNGSNSPETAEIARLIAHRVLRKAIDDALSISASQVDWRLRFILTYALASLIGSLITVMAIGFVCRTFATRARRSLRRVPRFNSPILRLLFDELRRKPPPPTYSEALNNSVFEEPILEGASPPPAPIELSITALSRDQVLDVRSRSMKPLTRVDVACSCDFPSLQSAYEDARCVDNIPEVYLDSMNVEISEPPLLSSLCNAITSSSPPPPPAVGQLQNWFRRFIVGINPYRRYLPVSLDVSVAEIDSEVTASAHLPETSEISLYNSTPSLNSAEFASADHTNGNTLVGHHSPLLQPPHEE